jgi:hypothetical protein
MFPWISRTSTAQEYAIWVCLSTEVIFSWLFIAKWCLSCAAYSHSEGRSKHEDMNWSLLSSKLPEPASSIVAWNIYSPRYKCHEKALSFKSCMSQFHRDDDVVSCLTPTSSGVPPQLHLQNRLDKLHQTVAYLMLLYSLHMWLPCSPLYVFLGLVQIAWAFRNDFNVTSVSLERSGSPLVLFLEITLDECLIILAEIVYIPVMLSFTRIRGDIFVYHYFLLELNKKYIHYFVKGKAYFLSDHLLWAVESRNTCLSMFLVFWTSLTWRTRLSRILEGRQFFKSTKCTWLASCRRRETGLIQEKANQGRSTHVPYLWIRYVKRRQHVIHSHTHLLWTQVLLQSSHSGKGSYAYLRMGCVNRLKLWKANDKQDVSCTQFDRKTLGEASLMLGLVPFKYMYNMRIWSVTLKETTEDKKSEMVSNLRWMKN